MSEHVRISREGPGIVLVTLTRPEKKNALTGEMYGALTDALSEADRTGAGAVVITGSGGCFTAGNDLGDFAAAATGRAADPPAQRFIRQLARTETPVVAAVDGLAIGIGTTMTFHCDLVYASPSATFRMPFVDLGLVPEAGSSYLLPRRVGLAKATDLLMLAEPYGAVEALRLGLVNALVENDGLVAHALAQAAKLAAKPRSALRATRRLIRGDGCDLADAMEAELVAFDAALRSPEAQERFRTFLAGRGTPKG